MTNPSPRSSSPRPSHKSPAPSPRGRFMDFVGPNHIRRSVVSNVKSPHPVAPSSNATLRPASAVPRPSSAPLSSATRPSASPSSAPRPPLHRVASSRASVGAPLPAQYPTSAPTSARIVASSRPAQSRLSSASPTSTPPFIQQKSVVSTSETTILYPSVSDEIEYGVIEDFDSGKSPSTPSRTSAHPDMSTPQPSSSRPATSAPTSAHQSSTHASAFQDSVSRDLDSSTPARPSSTKKSPFISSANVDKRPLSPFVPETSSAGIKSTKNNYSRQDALKSHPSKSHSPAVIISPTSTKANISLVIAIISTIIFGGIVGAVIYLAFFQ